MASILAISIVSAITLVMAVDSALDIRRERAASQAGLAVRAHLLASGLNDVLANYIYFSDVDALRDVADVVRSQPEVEYVRVFNREGRFLVTGPRTDDQSGYATGFATDPLALQVLQEDRTSLRFKDDALEVASPITFGREQLGVVEFGFNADAFRAEIRAAILQDIWQGAQLVVIGIFLSYFIAQYFARPIRRLAAAATKIGMGELEFTANGNRNDEIGELTRSFSLMAVNLRQSMGHLELRSEELKEANNQLTTEMEERKQLERQLSQAQKMESVGRLAGGVAHDFNNLLTAIIGYSQMSLQEAPPGSPINSHLQEVQKAAERAADLTGQLLAFSRRQVIEPKVIDPNDLVINLDKMLRRLIGEDTELVTLPATGLERVKADPGQIEQVLVNLAVNARDAMPKGGKLTIETANVTLDAEYVRQHGDASPGRHVMLVVSDTGTGMSEEVQEHIFEPFFTTKDVGEGTGLGLAICYGIVQQSGGHMEVCSEPGQGTSFKVYLPATEETYEAQTEIVDSSISPQGKETVLLAEDEPLVRTMVATVLRDRGYEVLEAANGEEALRMAQKPGGEGIELLLTDVVMPQMGGPELAEKLYATYPDIKVLFTSGYTGDSVSELNILPTGAEFLAKPYLPDALAVKVREVLDQRPAVPLGSGPRHPTGKPA